jgi:chromosome transmission fidelity protein 4
VPKNNVPVTQVAFSPTEHLLAWTDRSGSFHRWRDPIPKGYPEPIVKQSKSSKPTGHFDLFAKDGLDPNDDLGAEEHGEFEADPDANMDDQEFDDDNFVIDDLEDGGYRDTKANDQALDPKDYDGPVREMGITFEFVLELRLADLVPLLVSIIKSQPPFQPGSTPLVNGKRYLGMNRISYHAHILTSASHLLKAFNHIGVIEVTVQDTHNLVTADFFDGSIRNGINFTDHLKYDIGYIGVDSFVELSPHRCSY